MQLKLINPVLAFESVTGTRPNLCTIWRWQTKGSRGIRLESICVGGRRFCTIEMAQDFIEATNAARNASYPITAVVTPTKVREKQMAKAVADLDALLNNKKRTKSRA